MRFEATGLDGAWLVKVEPAHDERGFFARTFCEDEFRAHGLVTRFPQHSISSSSRKATLRGMHFQNEPHGEVKLVRCLNGSIWDVIIDLRASSPTFRQWRGFELSAENGSQLYIPKGFAHGFQTLSDNVQVNYLISEFYEPSAANGVRYDDPMFGISWPLAVSTISDKDLNWPLHGT
ncbi:dTDP-4-dehydrorhamnose 3,5-epimerase [Bradyrhizobium sp. USDA 4524]|uniref:dTDP-4-dehydrorhamnose 3,5-epimerase n=1 Tax=Bradyrhizobium brasilense TaxID=1419277 RepID=A0A1G6QUK3_9BRAD|nr:MULTISPECIES: dTDP-4-dehydrorhamnose 3,5-epimerase [Bradyrhizobium]MCC8970514.1 dTDP-4-dehydrorhamnose 3,5-epimerase [Bradyrhizobium brasilense]MCP1841798.1 dTDP-4-dehydrorhamnose 3,5-epimerase [Bradyrhizobium sp. USDA 4538]MCP1902362.1 dTDP-4-dehydrorhamnose 3,5-epimerase [Bradyrhizobium sp. USDA 4537]MCP1991981.1 dTDP-4-dehydrorhamnose 3,5-epimerase [Bradyrhizobium sp. USDA 4539]SDC95347.1 dTDP-4-dehydrorhamnose 3,5-epimerase [Bradyrhizobium brasilense]